MSQAPAHSALMSENYYYGRRPDMEQTHPDSPFRKFDVRCLRCRSLRLNVVGEYSEDAGEVKVYLVCPRCNIREELKVR